MNHIGLLSIGESFQQKMLLVLIPQEVRQGLKGNLPLLLLIGRNGPLFIDFCIFSSVSAQIN